MIKGGLKPTTPDSRDFKLGAFITLPPLSELPPNFILPGWRIKHQRDTDFCTAFASCGASELQEGVELSPEWVFAFGKVLSEDPDEWGQEIRTTMKVQQKIGAPEAKDVPLNVDNADDQKLRYIENYPAELMKKAVKHIKQSYATVTGPYDHFDNIRATMWKFRNEKRAVVTGVNFGWRLDQTTLDTIPASGTPHCMAIVGWVTENGIVRMVYANSYGTKTGHEGFHYVGRTVVNKFVTLYDAFMFIDMPPERVKYLMENGIMDTDSIVIKLYKRIVAITQKYLKLKKNR